MFKLIASDLDGTIIDNYSSISTHNLEAAKILNEKHIPLVICTGKTHSLSSDFCKMLNAKFGIFGNGSQIFDLTSNKEIDRKTFSQSELDICFSIAKKHNLHTHIYTEDSIITPELLYMDLRNLLLFPNKLNFEIIDSCFDYTKIKSSSIFKLIISSPSSLSMVKDELEKISNLNISHIFKTGIYKDTVINKEYEYLDICSANVSKGSALMQLSKYLNIDKKDILSIGDNLNDIDMFKCSSFCVAVANSHTLLKQYANYITHNPAANGGFAEAIYKFIPL